MASTAATGITQIRFYYDGNERNTPFNYHLDFCDNTLLAKYAPIKQFSIYTLPGTKFYLNQGTDAIIVGASGIYELDLRNAPARLTSIRFDRASMEIINESDNGYLIIDLIHEGEVGS